METVLIVDDEEDIVELIQYNMVVQGYTVLTALSGEHGISLSISHVPDLIILDLMLPGIGGLDVAKYLRQKEKTKNIPILMLTAKTSDTDIITGLESGATDYMCKPFGIDVLMARVRAILRRHVPEGAKAKEDTDDLENGLVINRNRYQVKVNGTPVNLTLTEFQLLSFLASKKGWVFSRNQIVDAIHGTDYAVTDRSIDVVISGLRKKLKPKAHVIETVRGVGYRYKE
ncbi:response regulator [uncultured Desulfobacter sp.]|uniref:response regulator n=1 Tax=uncultured Desulfobacter sp. TaxID=240139 RepID=UPI0029F4A227|nr:response regulator [uncultured Desulfobacter sp.]